MNYESHAKEFLLSIFSKQKQIRKYLLAAIYTFNSLHSIKQQKAFFYQVYYNYWYYILNQQHQGQWSVPLGHYSPYKNLNKSRRGTLSILQIFAVVDKSVSVCTLSTGLGIFIGLVGGIVIDVTVEYGQNKIFKEKLHYFQSSAYQHPE